jgi:hypothetical protein
MRTGSLIRWGGLSALFSGLTGIIAEFALYLTTGDLSISQAALTSQWFAFVSIAVLSTILSILGLVALFARQKQKMRGYGSAAFALAVGGTMLVFGHQWSGLFVVPVLAQTAPDILNSITTNTTSILAGGIVLSIFIMALGWILFGIASLRAKILPAGSIWLVMIGAVLILALTLIDFYLEKAAFNLGLIWMGWWLWREPQQET